MPRPTTNGRACSECGATNVIAIASSPQVRTGPPFERLYAVEPEGVQQIRPSHGWEPRSSSPSVQPSSTIRPSWELVATTSLTAIRPLPVHLDGERRELDDAQLPGEHAPQTLLEAAARDAGQEADPSEVDADDGDAAAEEAVEGAQDGAVAAEDDAEVRVAVGGRVDVVLVRLDRVEEQLDVELGGDALELFEPLLDALRAPVRHDGDAAGSAQATAAAIQASRSSGSVGCRVGGEMEEELPVPLRAGQAGVYDSARAGLPRQRGLGDFADDARVHRRVADDAAPDLLATRLELGLDEDDGLPFRRREGDRRREDEAHGDEGDVADDEARRERELRQRARVRALEDGDARVGAQARVELPVADVDRDDASGAALEQDVREAAGRRAEVEAVPPVRVDAERVEAVRELLPAAGDVRRRAPRARAGRRRRPAAPPCRSRGRVPP